MSMKNIKRVFRKTVCSVISATMLLAPTWSFGGETNMSAIGKESQKFANQLGTQAAGNLPTLSGNDIQIKGPNGKDMSFSKDELNSKSDRVQYQYGQEHIDKIKGYYDSGDKLSDNGDEEKKNLYANATSDKPTVEGHAYAIVKDLANMQKQDLSKDKMFDETRKIYDSIGEFAQGLADCKADTQIIKNKSTEHIPDYKVCSQVMDRSGTCTIYHNYQAGVVQHHDGPFNLDNCGEGCTQLWIGKVGNDYWAGSCSIYEEWTRVRVPNPKAVTRAVFEYAKWDDYMQVWVGDPGKEELIWAGPDGTSVFPPETAGRCERGTSWERNPNVDVTRFFKNVEKNAIVNFKIRVSVTGRGEGFGRIKIYFDKSKAVHDESWTPANCIEAALGVEDGFAKGNVRCTEMPSIDSKGCAWIDGVHVCSSDLNPTPIKALPNLCKRAEVFADFDFYKGPMDCWTDALGNRVCPNNQGGVLDKCTKYANDKKCGFIKSQCVDGATGKSGQCYVTDVTYDCGEDVVTEDVTEQTTYKCPGDISCMGNNCVDTELTVNKDLAKVMALMNAAQYMTQDMKCTGKDENGDFTGQENVTCSVFGGEAGECKIAVGGVADCCESVDGIGLNEYIAVIKAMSQMTSSLQSVENAGTVAGAASQAVGGFTSMSGPAGQVITEGVSWISKPFTSFVGNVSGAVDKITGPATAFMDNLKKKLIEKCQEALTKMFEAAGFPTGAGSAGAGATAGEVGKKTAEEAASQTMTACGTMFTVISWAYTAYVVAKMVIQLVYKCTEEEYEMVSQRDLKQCHYVGSYCRNKKLGVCIEKRQTYCCYESPLSRIMNEQIRKQGDKMGAEFNGFGTAKNPRCEGIPLDKIDKVDWNKVDLSEWISILKITDNYPTDELLNMEKLTGKGSKIDLDGNRLNSIDRTYKRFENIDADGLRIEGSEKMEVDVGALP